MLKDNLKYIIIGLSIIIASIIIVLFFPDPNYSRNHCYKEYFKEKVKIGVKRGFAAESAKYYCK